MFVAALAHAYAFPTRDYLDPAQQQEHCGRSFAQNLRQMFDMRDVVDDVQEIMEHTNDNMTQVHPIPYTLTFTALARGNLKVYSKVWSPIVQLLILALLTLL